MTHVGMLSNRLPLNKKLINSLYHVYPVETIYSGIHRSVTVELDQGLELLSHLDVRKPHYFY